MLLFYYFSPAATITMLFFHLRMDHFTYKSLWPARALPHAEQMEQMALPHAEQMNSHMRNEMLVCDCNKRVSHQEPVSEIRSDYLSLAN